MYCIKCGQQLPDDARFCSKCGAATVQQNGAAYGAQSFNDTVAAKAEDFAITDAAGRTDDAAQKASSLGVEIPDSLYAMERSVPSQVYKPRYTETKELFHADNLYKIKRKDYVNKIVAYSLLWDIEEPIQSDWFDEIWYEDYNIFGVKADRKTGLMDSSFQEVILGELIKIREGLYWVYRDGYWTLVNIRNQKIEELYSYDEMSLIDYDGVTVITRDARSKSYVTIVVEDGESWFWDFDDATNQAINLLPCKFDSIEACAYSNAFIVQQGNKYGYVFREGDTLDYRIKCVLDKASAFEGSKAKVTYNYEEYSLDKNGFLWGRGWLVELYGCIFLPLFILSALYGALVLVFARSPWIYVVAAVIILPIAIWGFCPRKKINLRDVDN